MAEEARFLKKKVRPGQIDVHPFERALVVYYEQEATVFGETGQIMAGDRKESQKIIRVKNLDERTDTMKLAQQIIARCSNLIQPSKLPELDHLLKYLRERKLPRGGSGRDDDDDDDDDNNNEAEKKAQRNKKKTLRSTKPADPGAFDSTEVDQTASLNDLDDYLEALYEEIPQKLRASALILQLARNPDNLEHLFDNPTLMGALARVLREEWQASTDLATNIIYIFFCFSSFSDFHTLILTFRIGALTISILQHELDKYDLWCAELADKRRRVAAGKDGAAGGASGGGGNFTAADLAKSQRKFDTLVRKQEQLFRVSFYMLLNMAENLQIEVLMVNNDVVGLLCRALNRRDNFELLILIVSFLKKLSIFAENVQKMVTQYRAVERLAKLLQPVRGGGASGGGSSRIGAAVASSSAGHSAAQQDDLLNITLRLLLNVSFNSAARMQIVKSGLLTRLVDLMTSESCADLALFILYNVSCEDRFKRLFLKTDCVPLLMKMILESERKQVDPEVMALAINLVSEPKIADLVSQRRGVRMLMKRAFKFHDQLIMKMLRNLSDHADPEIKMKFVDYISDLATVVTERGGGNSRAQQPARYKAEFRLECLGILSNLTLPELDFALIIEEFDLISWIRNQLSPSSSSSSSSSAARRGGVASEEDLDGDDDDDERKRRANKRPPRISSGIDRDDDFLLETVMLLGTICNDDACAKQIAQSGLIQLLINLINAKQEDDEIVCQIIYVFYQFIFHESTRRIIIKETEAPIYLIDLMHDKNAEIRRVADLTLDIISEFDSEWAEKIQLEKFRWHNSQWLEMMQEDDEHDNLERHHRHHHQQQQQQQYEDEERAAAATSGGVGGGDISMAMGAYNAMLADDMLGNLDAYYPEIYGKEAASAAADLDDEDFHQFRMNANNSPFLQDGDELQRYADESGRPIPPDLLNHYNSMASSSSISANHRAGERPQSRYHSGK